MKRVVVPAFELKLSQDVSSDSGEALPISRPGGRHRPLPINRLGGRHVLHPVPCLPRFYCGSAFVILIGLPGPRASPVRQLDRLSARPPVPPSARPPVRPPIHLSINRRGGRYVMWNLYMQR